MNKETAIFIEGSRSMLKKMLKDGGADEKWLNILKAWSEQILFEWQNLIIKIYTVL